MSSLRKPCLLSFEEYLELERRIYEDVHLW